MITRITPNTTPKQWLWYKVRTLFSSTTYIPPMLIWILAVLGLSADVHGLWNNSMETQVIVLASFVFTFGAWNVIQATLLERTRIRYQRELGSFEVMHQLAEVFRDYRTQRRLCRDQGEQWLMSTPPEKDAKDCLTVAGTILLNKYIQLRHRGDISMTVKYPIDHKLASIRIGENNKGRDQDPEPIANCPVYTALNQRKVRYIHVADAKNYTTNELAILGCDAETIQQRAQRHGYRTFLALPLRTGNVNPDRNPITSTPLGFVGFDCPEAYGFGNISEEEIQFLAAITDSMTEIVQDLTQLQEHEDIHVKGVNI